MGLVRLRIRELAEEKGWTLKEVAQRSNIPYTTITTYARSLGMATADVTALIKLARVFDVAIEDLIEVVEE
jgi:putative transcriptional regulator